MKEKLDSGNLPENIVVSRTSTPTGGVVAFGENGEFRIAVRKQNFDTACGQACLEMLGYSLEGMEFDRENGVTTLDLAIYFDSKEVTDWRNDFKFDVPHMVAGEKIKTGRTHWYLRVGDTVVNPEDGKVEDADAYEQREIREILAVMKIPFKT